MFRSLLKTIGFARYAPSPYKKYGMFAGRFGALPILGFLAWSNRHRIGSLLKRGQSAHGGTNYSSAI